MGRVANSAGSMTATDGASGAGQRNLSEKIDGPACTTAPSRTSWCYFRSKNFLRASAAASREESGFFVGTFW